MYMFEKETAAAQCIKEGHYKFIVESLIFK